jgi:hypothetical protein
MNATSEEGPVFPNCTSEHVFSEMAGEIRTPEARALWSRLHEEVKRQGVGAAETYLSVEFTRLKEEFAKELSRGATE